MAVAHGVRRLSWGELDATINRLAGALVARGVKGGGRVALMLPNGIEYLIAQQALARIGGTAVQIGYRSKPAEIAYILENAEPKATLLHASFLESMREARGLAGGKGGPMVVVGGDGKVSEGDATDWDRALAASSPEVPAREETRGGDGGGVIVYTSGTTGKPKGANRSWKKTGFESVADMILQVGMTADDRHLVVCPLYHSAAPAFVAIMAALGATIVLMNHFEPEGALDIIQRERITCTLMVPTMLIRITNLPKATLAKYDTSSLRWVMSGAAPLSTDAARRFMEQFGPPRPAWSRSRGQGITCLVPARSASGCAATTSGSSTSKATRSSKARSASSTPVTRRSSPATTRTTTPRVRRSARASSPSEIWGAWMPTGTTTWSRASTTW